MDALAAYGRECGFSTGPFELFGPNASRTDTADIVKAIDEAAIPRVIESAFAKASSALPGGNLTVCVYAAPLTRGMPYLGGVGGVAVGSGVIKLFLHPTPEKFSRVPYTIAHEYDHDVLRAASDWSGAASILIREGKADNFAASLYPDLEPGHTRRLTAEELAIVWPRFLEYRASMPANFSTDFLISANKPPLPLWSGYRLGFEMVEYYLASGRRGAARDWLTADPDAIVEHFARSPRVASLPSRK